ncbi:hypothetical protein HRbin36_00763 [bacterium HR36]|nr:hypothetical protein HRbin36_00763 [bacterium HR36]
MARSVENAQFAILVRDVQLRTILKVMEPPPPEVQPFVPLLEKARQAAFKVELAPKAINLHLSATFADSDAAKQAASLLQKLYEEHAKPNLPQLAAFAPELMQDLQQNLRFAAENDALQITVSARYSAILTALQNVLPLMLAKPPFPVPPPGKP